MPCSAEFRLSVTRALGDQLAALLDELTPAPLTQENLDTLDSRPGVYLLYYQNKPVYVGKTDRSLPQRLGKHRFKLSGRLNIVAADVGFICAYVEEDLAAVAPEKTLIARYRAQGGLPWDAGGFGINDPGIIRDDTTFGPDHFDVMYPADLERPVPEVKPGTYSAAELVTAIKSALPFVFRFKADSPRGRKPHRDFNAASVTVPRHNLTADELFSLLAAAMPGWQITALPGYVIMYPVGASYPSARKIYTAT